MSNEPTIEPGNEEPSFTPAPLPPPKISIPLVSPPPAPEPEGTPIEKPIQPVLPPELVPVHDPMARILSESMPAMVHNDRRKKLFAGIFFAVAVALLAVLVFFVPASFRPRQEGGATMSASDLEVLARAPVSKRDKPQPRLSITARRPSLVVDDSLTNASSDDLLALVDEALAEEAPAETNAVLSAETASEPLPETGSLAIGKIKLCRGVQGFGHYDAFEKNSVPVGSLPLVLVYAEVDHAKADATEDGRFLMRFASAMALLDPTNEQVEIWTQEPVEVTDESLSRRHDFHVAQRLSLPPTAPGLYTLRLRITDLIGGAMCETNIPLELTSDTPDEE